MLRLHKQDLHRFGKKVLIEQADRPAWFWHRYRNVFVVGFNYYIIHSLCRRLPPCRLKNALYRLSGAKIGKRVCIVQDCLLDPIFPELIRIDDDAVIGWGAKLYTHEFTQDRIRIGSVHCKKGSLVGEWSVVRPGITIGEHATIGAMSYVNKDVADNERVGGVPARKL